jgi:hypothetical protein
MLDDMMQIRILLLQNHVQKMNKFHVGVTPHLTKYSGTFHRFVSKAVKFAK